MGDRMGSRSFPVLCLLLALGVLLLHSAREPTLEVQPTLADSRHGGKPCEPLRIACIGDSLTEPAGFGGCASPQHLPHYPCSLRPLLNGSAEVRIYGCSKTTGHYSGARAWVRRCADKYQAALDFAPQLVFAMFGTNDAMPEFWLPGLGGMGEAALAAKLVSDVAAIVARFLALPSAPLVVVLLPPSHTRHLERRTDGDRAKRRQLGGMPLRVWREHRRVLVETLRPALRRVGPSAEILRPALVASTSSRAHGPREHPCGPSRVEVADLWPALPEDDTLFLDGLHPNLEGASLLAEHVAKEVRRLCNRTAQSRSR